jgi:hypothetical protein
MANAREAIELVIEDRLARGEPIPADIQPKIDRITAKGTPRDIIEKLNAAVVEALTRSRGAIQVGRYWA